MFAPIAKLLRATFLQRAGQSAERMHDIYMSLKDYTRKRDFTRTGEPKGEKPSESGRALLSRSMRRRDCIMIFAWRLPGL